MTHRLNHGLAVVFVLLVGTGGVGLSETALLSADGAKASTHFVSTGGLGVNDTAVLDADVAKVRNHCKCCRGYFAGTDEEGHRFDATSAQDSVCGYTVAEPLAISYLRESETPQGVIANEGDDRPSDFGPVAKFDMDPLEQFWAPRLLVAATVAGTGGGPDCSENDRMCESDLVQDSIVAHATFHSGTAGKLCEPAHIECNPGDPEFTLFAALKRGDYAEVARRYRTMTEFVLINEHRGMLQMTNCGGTGISWQMRADLKQLQIALDETAGEAPMRPNGRALQRLLLR